MTADANTSPSKQLTAAVAACRAALPRKRNVILRVCVRRVFENRQGERDLGDPQWRVWDGTRAGLREILVVTGAAPRAMADIHQFTLAATHDAVSFQDALPASRDITDLVRQLVPA